MELVKNNEKAEFVTDFSDFQNSIFLLLLTFKLSYVFNKRYHDPWPNLKNLRLVPLKIVSNVSRFKPALNLNRVLADLNRGSNSLNSISGQRRGMTPYKLKNFCLEIKF